MANLIDLIPIVHAQTTDAVSQPTFGPIDGGSGGIVSSSILIRSDKTAIVVGELIKVRIEIKTNDISLSEYRIVINYDPTKLTAIDQDSATIGTQLNFLDPVFQVKDPIVDNNNVVSGQIILNAKAPNGGSSQLNRDVAEIQFQAQSMGSTTITVVTGTQGSHLIRPTGTDLSYTSNEVTIQTSSQQTSTTGSSTSGSTTTGSGTTKTTSGSTNTNTSTTTGTIPNTAIGDTSFIGSVILGLAFVVTGISLVFNKNSRKKKEHKTS